MKACKKSKFAVKAGQQFPVEIVGLDEVQIVFKTSNKNRGMSAKAAVVAIIAIFVMGAVTAATLYGVATTDYSVLKELAESAKTIMKLLVKIFS